MAGPAPSGTRAAFGFAGAGAGEALAVVSSFLASAASLGEATGSVVASAAAGAAFGFAGAGAGEALAVASGFLAGAGSSGEATGSAVAVASCSPVPLIQHSAPAGNDRNVNPVTGTRTVSRRDLGFMIHPPFLMFIHAHSPSVFEKRKSKPQDGLPAPNRISPFLAGWGLVSDNFRAVGSGGCLPDR